MLRLVEQAAPVRMCVDNTPVEYYEEFRLFVKREDLSTPGGPNFSKCRGVFKHIAVRNESCFGVLDTAHSQGGHAVAKACNLLGRGCVLYYPVRKGERGAPLKPQQLAAQTLGARLIALPAGRSAVLYHKAKKALAVTPASYFMPNALKLPETVSETAAEVERTALPDVPVVLVPASSATIAAGVVLGLHRLKWRGVVIVHLGYSRPHRAVRSYIEQAAGLDNLFNPLRSFRLEIIDEGYSYADESRSVPIPPWQCNPFYDLKTFRYWLSHGLAQYDKALLWNIG